MITLNAYPSGTIEINPELIKVTATLPKSFDGVTYTELILNDGTNLVVKENAIEIAELIDPSEA